MGVAGTVGVGVRDRGECREPRRGTATQRCGDLGPAAAHRLQELFFLAALYTCHTCHLAPLHPRYGAGRAGHIIAKPRGACLVSRGGRGVACRPPRSAAASQWHNSGPVIADTKRGAVHRGCGVWAWPGPVSPRPPPSGKSCSAVVGCRPEVSRCSVSRGAAAGRVSRAGVLLGGALLTSTCPSQGPAFCPASPHLHRLVTTAAAAARLLRGVGGGRDLRAGGCGRGAAL
ncbi:hypothetical protein E2C01_093710 [Portunus trituberculatus]|uniref:Uncharacterized protein n=1 Tax=Portunus trituberculatus TaxID=210409 RepID=A0A5B7JQI4_PORTR|nr:hypothetical protein [Portunus trituberculatus]